jgi:glycosyltransferase involved in cell wall biosynthesis
MKRVLIFSLAYYPHVGGAEVSIKEITDRISPSDIEFHMVTLRFSRAEPAVEKIGNVLVHRIYLGGANLFSKFLFQFFAANKALVLSRTNHYDAIWAVMAHSAGVPAVLYKMAYPKVFYILNLQEGDPIPHIEKKMTPIWPLFTRAFIKADVVQALSTHLAKWARARGFTGPIEIIPNAVDSQRFLGDPVPHEGTVLITTSRLVHKNAIDDVIRAVALLPQVRFLILGTGPEEAALKKLAQTLGVAERVEFLDHIDNTDLPKYLHEADIFIRPSRSEGFGISFAEAMAAGLPVIATQEGGIADFLFDAKKNPDKPTTGWAVEVDSPQDIARAVQDILSNPEQVQKVITNARALVAEKYDWDHIAKLMRERVFSSIL